MPTVPYINGNGRQNEGSLANGGDGTQYQQEKGGFLSGVMEMLGLREAKAKPTQAPPRQTYPTKEEAEFAQRQGYAYGQGSEPYAKEQQYQFLSGDPNKEPLETRNIPAEQLKDFKQKYPEATGALSQYYMRAQLAVEGSPLAKLGFDPTKVAVDVTRKPEDVNILGMYSPSKDDIYSNVYSASTIIHESIHRGIQKLKESEFWDPEFKDITKGQMEEYVVRHLMETKMGNPEKAEEVPGPEGVGRQQRDRARYLFTKGPMAQDYTGKLERMEKAAADYIAKKRPGGPR
jgi:hypothetical protein